MLQQSYKFPTYSPGGARLCDFVTEYNGSKVCTRGNVSCLWLSSSGREVAKG